MLPMTSADRGLGSKEAIVMLKDDRRMLTAPTGSGKSTVVEALGLHDLARGMKVIVAIPQLSVASGYECSKLTMSSGNGTRGRFPSSWNSATLADEAKEKWRLAELDSEQTDARG